jgi:ectoine hydroxylase-related dioxygenase (phytanoyl-CoA dioxygenase family)
MALSAEQLAAYKNDGFVTINQVFTPGEMDRAIEEATTWQHEFIEDLTEADKKWYLDQGTSIENQLRKLDNPVSQKAFFREMALSPLLISMVEELIGKQVVAFFSQIFFKPPHGGGPKPIHQDNFYFGPDQRDQIITLWIAFDHATIENGCLYYGKGTHKGDVLEHFAPEYEPFNYQIPEPVKVSMTAAPVLKGGINLHHGNTFHQSSDNHSGSWRRAMAVHYMQSNVTLESPIFKYDASHFVNAF